MMQDEARHRQKDLGRPENHEANKGAGCVSVVQRVTPERSAKDLLLNELKPRPNKETV
jgi:hypothetical protein